MKFINLIHKTIFCGILFVFCTPLMASEDEKETFLFHELTPSVAFYVGDTLRSLVAGNLNYTQRFSKLWWLSSDVYLGKVALDEREDLSFRSGDLFWIAGLGGVFNTPVRFGFEGEGWKTDLYMSVGPAFFRLGEKNIWGGFIGGGLTAHTPWSWLALRADLKNFFYRLSNIEGSNFNGDMALSLGMAFQF